jgi:hypothetical protein
MAFVQTVEVALRLQLLRGARGFARARNELRRHRELGRALHFYLQTTLGALALRLGWDVELEPGHPPADLLLRVHGSELGVETKVLEPSAASQARRIAVDGTMDRLRASALRAGVWVGGTVSEVPSEAALGDATDWITRSAPFVRSGGTLPPYRQGGFELVLVRDADPSHATLAGPLEQEDQLRRLLRTVATKAEQMRASGAEWLCIENLTGLFAFTRWGRLDMRRKVSLLHDAVHEAVPGDALGGLIVCSGCSWFNGAVSDEGVETSAGGFGLRYAVAPGRARETIVIPIRTGGSEGPDLWRALFDAERDWLAWALAEVGLPPIDEILAPST